MKRREFIVQSGSMVTAAMLFPTNLLISAIKNKSLRGIRRPDPEDFSQPILKAIAMGMNAPNPHNSQAWKFKILSDTEALFYIDENRLLTATDPPARQMHIGCGCFLETLRLGASTLGQKAQIERLPEGEYAYSQIGHVPVARIRVVPSDVDVLPLSSAIYSRQTNRSFYTGDLITTIEFEAIIAKTIPAHARIICENQTNSLKRLIDILYEGMVVETQTYETYDESRIWFRSSQKKIETMRDGINLRTDGSSGIMLKIMEFIVDESNPKSWHSDTAKNAFLKRYRQKMDSAEGVVMFQTDTNTTLDWLKTGEDYVRFQLAADQMGFVIHPVSQVLQEYPEMDALRTKFAELMGVSEPATIQMGVRIGRGEKLYYSYRRNPGELLI